VINIASLAAHIGVTPEVVYSTLKAAVVHYTRCLASEMRPYGVRVNAVSPGPTKTARFQATRTTDPAMMEKSERTGAFPMTSTPDEFGQFIRQEAGRWQKVLQETNIKFD